MRPGPATRLLAAGALCFGTACRPARTPRTAPLAWAVWAWDSPFELPASQVSMLASMDVSRVFVRAATLSFDGRQIVPIFRQRWISAGGFRGEVFATYNMDAGALRHFREFRSEAIADALVETYREDFAAANRAQIKLSGLQMDIDCPTSQLSKYAEVARRLRARLPKDVSLSATGLTSWLGKPALTDFVRPLSYFVPQFYEGVIPKRLDQHAPIGDLDGARAARRFKFGLRRGRPGPAGPGPGAEPLGVCDLRKPRRRRASSVVHGWRADRWEADTMLLCDSFKPPG